MKRLFFTVVAVSLLCAQSSYAQEKRPSAATSAAPQATSGQSYEVKSFAVVDLKKIMEESFASKTAQKQINEIKDKYILEIKDNDKALQARQKELMDQKKALSEKEFVKKVNEFKKKVEQERADAMKKQKVVEAAFVKSLELIKEEIQKIVADIAKQKNIDVVVPTSQLLYSKSALDISDEVLKTLNERLTNVDINIKSGNDKKSDTKTETQPATQPTEKK